MGPPCHWGFTQLAVSYKCMAVQSAGAVCRCVAARLPCPLQGLVLLAPAVDITELWWQALSAAEQADARATGFVPLGKGTEVGSFLGLGFRLLPWCDRTRRACCGRCP